MERWTAPGVCTHDWLHLKWQFMSLDCRDSVPPKVTTGLEAELFFYTAVQELRVRRSYFSSKKWKEINDGELLVSTGVSERLLAGLVLSFMTCASEKMPWRETTRVEDRAPCNGDIISYWSWFNTVPKNRAIILAPWLDTFAKSLIFVTSLLSKDDVWYKCRSLTRRQK